MKKKIKIVILLFLLALIGISCYKIMHKQGKDYLLEYLRVYYNKAIERIEDYEDDSLDRSNVPISTTYNIHSGTNNLVAYYETDLKNNNVALKMTFGNNKTYSYLIKDDKTLIDINDSFIYEMNNKDIKTLNDLLLASPNTIANNLYEIAIALKDSINDTKEKCEKITIDKQSYIKHTITFDKVKIKDKDYKNIKIVIIKKDNDYDPKQIQVYKNDKPLAEFNFQKNSINGFINYKDKDINFTYDGKDNIDIKIDNENFINIRNYNSKEVTMDGAFKYNDEVIEFNYKNVYKEKKNLKNEGTITLFLKTIDHNYDLVIDYKSEDVKSINDLIREGIVTNYDLDDKAEQKITDKVISKLKSELK